MENHVQIGNTSWQKITLPNIPINKDEAVSAIVSLIRNKADGHTCNLIRGDNGVGKTYTLSMLEKELDPSMEIVRTSFYESSRDTPFSQIRGVLEKLLENLLENDKNSIENLKKFEEVFSSRYYELGKIIPLINTLNQNHTSSLNSNYPDSIKNRMLNALTDLMEWIISQLNQPVIILLDDCEWMDESTADFIEQCLTDNLSKLHFVLSISRKNSPQKFISNPSLVQTIHVHDVPKLNLEGTKLLLEHLVENNLEKETIHDFSHFSKGSFYTLQELLSNCAISKQLTYNADSDKWIWTQFEDEFLSNLSNLDSILDNKLASLSKQNQNILALAACFGDNINSVFVSKITENKISDVKKCFQEAHNLNLIIHNSELESIVSERVNFRFTNNYVQQFFKSQLLKETQKETHGKIAEYLTSGSLLGLDERDLFEATYHINQAAPHYSSSRFHSKHYSLNLKAMIRAKKMASYKLAYKYLHEVLNNNLSNWNSDYANSYDLHYHGYSIALLNGDEETATQLFSTCINHAKSLHRHELESEKLLLEVQFGKLEDALDTGINLLKKLGYPVKKNFGKVYLIKEVLTTHFQVKRIKEEDILSMSEITNPRTILALEVFQRMFRAAYYIIPELNAVLAMRSLRIMLKQGVNKDAYAHLLAYSILIGVSSDNVKLSGKYFDLSYKMAERFNVNSGDYIFGRAFSSAFRRPLRSTLNDYYLSIKKSYEQGDYFSSTEPTVNLSLMHLCCGLPLSEVVYKANQNKTLCFELENKDYFEFQKVFIHGIEKLANHNTTYEQGEIDYILKNTQYSLTKTIHKVIQIINLSHTNQWEEAFRISKKMSREIEFATGLFIQFDYYLYNCLAGLMSYNKLKFSHRRKLNKSVRKTLKKFKRWNASCPENHEHNIHLLLGAVAYKDEDYDTAFLMFEKGSRLAEKNNFLNKQVLAQKLKLAAAHYMSTDILTTTAEELKVLDKAWKA